ncbi:predicted protein [Nematostella vectensis]|uniref:Spliceosome-associated protein CWC15 homolog n=1 Tax=Nematostella vectensis TaxID=45351 RepID=A7SIX1_NEMVE|nr:spliceosome-associated protein CWC15 homolog [Nematostella vectensis]EDO36355.1 predicted protein [Nematostella vectensis]|eukprot:XP_001628418.1 predicted protein [Nematostella vectensis]
MTTAARPTWDTARGGRGKGEGDLSALSKQYSSRDLPSHNKLKHRQTGQDTTEEIRSRDLRKELEEREHQAARERAKEKSGRGLVELPKRPRLEQAASNLDADDPVDDDDEDDDSDASDDEDDTAELLAELQRIKKERAQEELRKEKQKKEEEEKVRMENIMSGNPLLNPQSNFKVKRRWDDDVVFKNCAKGEDEKGQHFINDMIRSDFHRKFMEKYIK